MGTDDKKEFNYSIFNEATGMFEKLGKMVSDIEITIGAETRHRYEIEFHLKSGTVMCCELFLTEERKDYTIRAISDAMAHGENVIVNEEFGVVVRLPEIAGFVIREEREA